MAKKSAASEFNMSESIREMLMANPKLSSKEVSDAIMANYPGAKINKNSFSVGFYTIRKKLGIGKAKRGRKVGVRMAKTAARSSVAHPSVDLAMIQSTARFLSQVGGAEAALQAIKFVQAAQMK